MLSSLKQIVCQTSAGQDLTAPRHIEFNLIKEFKKTTTATATGTSLNKRLNEQNSGCSSIINLGQFLRVLSKKQYTRKVWSRGKQLVLFSRES